MTTEISNYSYRNIKLEKIIRYNDIHKFIRQLESPTKDAIRQYFLFCEILSCYLCLMVIHPSHIFLRDLLKRTCEWSILSGMIQSAVCTAMQPIDPAVAMDTPSLSPWAWTNQHSNTYNGITLVTAKTCWEWTRKSSSAYQNGCENLVNLSILSSRWEIGRQSIKSRYALREGFTKTNSRTAEQPGTNSVSKNVKAESTMDRLLQRYFVIKLRQATLLWVKVDTKKLTMNWATLILFPKHESNPKNYKYF